MEDTKRELRVVKEELECIEQQIEELLSKQRKLVSKKVQIEKALREDASRASDVKWDKSDFKWSHDLIEKLKSVYHISALRALQLETMNATLDKKDCFLIMPTGGGKSLCFQLPAVLDKGTTVVISPLISLMEDQLMALSQLGVDAKKLCSSNSREETKAIFDSMLNPKTSPKLLYVTPEMLAKSKRFMAKLEKMYDAGLFARLVIDEVHCCSQWGHDFRTSYKFLGVMKRQFPGVPLLGLTATATTHVLQDCKKMLGVTESVTFKASFNRANLYYEVIRKASGLKATVEDTYKLINSRFKNQSGIVYCFSQKDCEEVARELQKLGIAAGCYHGTMEAKWRSETHVRWTKNKIQVVVATIAFGMGIDKSDVRFVIHHSISKSMENYYQESGRAGRDDQRAHCILFASFADIFRQSTMVFSEQTGTDNLYGMVAYAYDLKRCRRSMIASHFGEIWESSLCSEMCDHCDKSLERQEDVDVIDHCREILTVLDDCKAKDQRVTGLKLIDLCLAKRKKAKSGGGLSRAGLERLVVYLLSEGYLREDMHFTPYTTISYILPGSRGNSLLGNNQTLKLTFHKDDWLKTAGKSLPKSAKKASRGATPQAGVSSSHPTPVTATVSKTHKDGDQINGLINSHQVSSAGPSRPAKRKSAVICLEDSDSSSDFDEVAVGSKKSRPGACVIVDSDEDTS